MRVSHKILWRVLAASVLVALLALGGAGLWFRQQGKEVFRLNSDLIADGYYMAGFEFKLLGIVHHLDNGRYLTALTTLTRLRDQLESREGLTKIPEAASPEEEARFFRALQDPQTGAFIDPTFPFCSYNEPTENVVGHLAALARESGGPLTLDHPLRYLDEIAEPEALRAFLDEVSTIGWLGNRFPETTYVFARSLASVLNGESAIRENQLYDFSPAYLEALRDWFHDTQDPETGYWGPRSRRDGSLARVDLNNTASVIKIFLDRDGQDRVPEQPLRYRDRMVATTLELIDRPLPEGAGLDAWHDWNISTTKGIRMLLRHLWAGASPEQRARARQILSAHVEVKFARFHVPESGGFSLYPETGTASLDGTATMILGNLGAFSAERQARLWGAAEETAQDLGRLRTERLAPGDLAEIAEAREVNSLRVYTTPPEGDGLLSEPGWVIYPQPTPVMDAAELVPRVLSWLRSDAPALGNWTSRARLLEDYGALPAGDPARLPLPEGAAVLNEALQGAGQLTIIGFDVLQVPVARLDITLPDPA